MSNPEMPSQFDGATLQRRRELSGNKTGPAALMANMRVFALACFTCLGALIYGYNQGMFSSLLTMTSFGQHMNATGGYINDSTKKGWLTSILELGAWFATLYSGFLAEILSRKYAIMASTSIFCLGVVIQCTAITSSGSASILGGRFVTGMGVGGISVLLPMYISETAPPEVRGALVSVYQLAIEVGIMVSFWIGYGCNFIGGTGQTQSDAAWLVPLALQLVPGVILLAGMGCMPFSPRWLIHHDHEKEARCTLAHLRGLSTDHELIEIEFLEIKAQSMFEKETVRANWPSLTKVTPWNSFKLQFVAIGSLFRSMPMFRRSVAAVGVMLFQQWTGINAILYYAPSIFGFLGLGSNTTSLLATGVVGIVMLVATIPTVLYVDRIGRKPVLIGGAIGMAACHLIISVIYARNQYSWAEHSAAGWAAIAMVWLFVFHFGYSWGPAAWILVAEIWPLSSRPYGVSLGASSNWMFNFVVGQVTPDMFKSMAWGTFVFFGLMTFFGALFIWWYVPETKQVTLEEMDILFGSSGVAQADRERMAAINRQIGLDGLLGRSTTDDTTVEEHKYIVESKH